jgi:hypothetical protein
VKDVDEQLQPLLYLFVSLGGFFAADTILRRSRRAIFERAGRVELRATTTNSRLAGGSINYVAVALMLLGTILVVLATDNDPWAFTAFVAGAWGATVAGIYRGLAWLASDGDLVLEAGRLSWQLGGSRNEIDLNEPFEVSRHRILIEVHEPDSHTPVWFNEVEYVHVRQHDVEMTFAHTVATHAPGSHPEDLKLYEMDRTPPAALHVVDEGERLIDALIPSRKQ